MPEATGSARPASWFEVVAARAWNLLNEGRSFHPIFAVSLYVLWQGENLLQGRWEPLALGLLAGLPAVAVYSRWDFPLHLRWALWVPPAALLTLAGPPPWPLLLIAAGLYLFFTIFFWGSLYYHLRIGTPLTNFTRFWRLVLENSDSTSGNLQEQLPKAFFALSLMAWGGAGAALDRSLVAGIGVGVGVLLWLFGWALHRWAFTWKPRPERVPPISIAPGFTLARRTYVVVIDGCRRDKLRLARTPFLDRLAREGTSFTRMETVYPARTVVCFSSMLTGALPEVHGMRSNLVLSLGVKCESIFDTLRERGKRGVLLACAHLIDAFGSDCRSFTAVAHNDRVDGLIMAKAREIIAAEDPDLFVVQLIAPDQTGHSLGVHYPEYLEKIAEADAHIASFYGWLQEQGKLDDAAFVVMADHGQSRGIGGHGHLDEGERYVPFIIAGPGVPAGRVVEEPRSILSLAPTVADLLDARPPSASHSPSLLPDLASPDPQRSERLVVVIPARNEAQTVGQMVRRIPRDFLPGLKVEVLVVDDGSTDGTARAAREAGADHLFPGPALGLGAAVRTGFRRALELGADYAVLIDADGEYPPEEIPELVAPLRLGEADYVLGSRFLGYIRRMRLLRRVGNYAFTLLQSLLLGRWITDGQTGMRALNRAALRDLDLISDYNYAQVMTLNLVRQGFRLAQVPVTYEAHPDPTRSFVRFGPYMTNVLTAIWREMLRDPRPAAAAARSAQR